jgi:hypothetical protein
MESSGGVYTNNPYVIILSMELQKISVEKTFTGNF